jgi:predicted nucleotide-binding protein with TIR-like domain
MPTKPNHADRLENLLNDFDRLPRADRQAAYEYVQDNMGAFGGPPKRLMTDVGFEGFTLAVVESWAIRAEAALVEIFGPANSRVTRFQAIMNEGGWNQINRLRVAQRLRGIVESARKDFLEGHAPAPQGTDDTEPGSPDPAYGDGKSVFVVHGRDEGAKESVARFLHKLGLKPVVLHEQPNKGGTVIEKFEANAAVDFAVVLLTPDDEGNILGFPNEKKPRARQNVILELGYFVGRIGRGKVCALYKGGVELPSDFNGVIYVGMDDPNGWQLLLAREIKAAGISVDLNKAV